MGYRKSERTKLILTQAGGFLPSPIKDKFYQFLPDVPFVVMYGQTEFCGRISQGEYNSCAADGAVGCLLEEIEAVTSDNGELYIYSPSVCLNADKLMKRKDFDGKAYYSTGDLAEIKGIDLFINGRNQNFIKIGVANCSK